jgi:hypothetical protein
MDLDGELVHLYQDFFFDNTLNLVTDDSGTYTQNYVGYDNEIGCENIERRADNQTVSVGSWPDWSSTTLNCNSTLNQPINPQYSYRVVCDVAPPGVSQTVLAWDARNVFYDENYYGVGDGGWNTTGAISYFTNGNDACNSLDLDTSYLGGIFQETYEGIYYLREQDLDINLSFLSSEEGINCDCLPDGTNCHRPGYPNVDVEDIQGYEQYVELLGSGNCASRFKCNWS